MLSLNFVYLCEPNKKRAECLCEECHTCRYSLNREPFNRDEG